jgi:diguanylate cyclase (GGDEF)-like protein
MVDLTDEAAPARGSWSLRREFGRLLVLAAILPGLAFSLFVLLDQGANERRVASQRLATSARTTAASIDQFVGDHLAAVSLMADLAPILQRDWPARLEAMRERYPSFITAIAVDARGDMLAAVPATRLPAGPLPSVVDRDYYAVPRQTLQPYVSNAFRGRGLGNDPLVAVSAPVVREDRFDGVVEGSIRVDAFTRELGQAFLSRGYELLLLDRSQRVIFATPAYGLAFQQPVDVLRRFGPVSADGKATLQPGLFADGSSGLTARSSMRSGWTLVLAIRDDQLMVPATGRVWALLGLLAVLTLGVLLASWWQMRQLARGTRTLLDGLKGMAFGSEVPARLMRNMPVELEPVAGAIGDLSERFNRAYRDLQASLEQQRHLAQSLRETVASREAEIASRTAELRIAAEELDRMSRTDPLTGALNRRGFEDWSTRVADTHADAGTLGVLVMDIDWFKRYNDRYGHPAGDLALKRVVAAARTALRGEHDEIVRSGGEEFLLLLPGADRARALDVAERIRAAVQAAGIPHEDSPLEALTVSIGIALASPAPAPGVARDVAQAIADADAALYRAKHAGRNRIAD